MANSIMLTSTLNLATSQRLGMHFTYNEKQRPQFEDSANDTDCTDESCDDTSSYEQSSS